MDINKKPERGKIWYNNGTITGISSSGYVKSLDTCIAFALTTVEVWNFRE